MMLQGKTALITGGGTGIGRATAQRFAEEGATVWLLGIDEASLIETQALIGSACHYRLCDVTDVDQLTAAIDDLDALDIAVSNAAVSYPTPLDIADLSEWRRLVEVNQWGPVHTSLIAGRHMQQRRIPGRILLVASILGHLAEPGSAAYGMAKGALHQFTRQLAVEWADHGILVNAVDPGAVLTPMSIVGGQNEYDSDWFHRFFINPARPRIPLRRPGRPEEIAEALLFLANPRNSYCTGHVLTVDGGLTATF